MTTDTTTTSAAAILAAPTRSLGPFLESKFPFGVWYGAFFFFGLGFPFRILSRVWHEDDGSGLDLHRVDEGTDFDCHSIEAQTHCPNILHLDARQLLLSLSWWGRFLGSDASNEESCLLPWLYRAIAVFLQLCWWQGRGEPCLMFCPQSTQIDKLPQKSGANRYQLP